MAKGTGILQPRATLASAHVLAITMILLLLAVFVIGTGWLVWRGYGETRDRASAAARSAAQVVATNAEWIVETSRQVLLRVDNSLDAELELLPHVAPDSLATAVASLPGGARVYVVAADGSTKVTTDPEFRDLDVRDREYFAAPAAGSPWHTSSLLVSRLNGSQIFAISKRLERNGAFAGVAIISFSSDLLKRVWDSLDLDVKSTVSLLRDDGMLVLRFPTPDGPVDLSNYVLFTDYLRQAPEGVYDAVSPVDRVERVVAYRLLPDLGLLALASLSREETFSQFFNAVALAMTLVVPVALALGLVAWWIWRLLNADARRRVELSRTLETNQVLLREIHHRVKNNLQAVSALVNLQPIAPEAKRDMAQRVAAMVAVHEHIYTNDEFSDVDAAQYIRAIVDNLIKSTSRAIQVEYDLMPLKVHRDKAMPIGLIVNEVVSNALKYAFVDGSDPRLLVRLSRDAGMGELVIADNGSGFDPAVARSGMGSKLLTAFSRQLDTRHHYTFETGTRFSIRFALS